MLPVKFAGRLATRWPFEGFGDFDPLAKSVLNDRMLVDVNVDIREDENNFYIDADLPGFTEKDINVTCEDGVLTIGGERETESVRESENFHIAERRSGQFKRSFRLANCIDDKSVDAKLRNGVLTVTLAKRPEVKPRRIEVTSCD
jgi:HSP20 family protein